MNYYQKMTMVALASIALVVGVLPVSQVGAQATTVATGQFVSNLTIGSRGTEVVALQTFLENRGFLVMPAGVAKGYFGALTRSALAKYQAANGIAPAVGYFGPITRAHVNNAVVVVTPPNNNNNGGNNNGGNVLRGGDGDFKDFDILGNPNNEDVGEGETVDVLAFEFTADDSDLRVERVDVIMTDTDAQRRPWRVFDELVLLRDGDEVATIDASDEDSWDETEDDEYMIRFDDVNEIVRENDDAKFTVAVTAQDDLDQNEMNDWAIFLADQGIRAENARGIQVYEGDADELADASDERTFTLEEAESGDLNLTVRRSENEDLAVEVAEDDTTDDVLLYSALLESQNGDNNIEEVTISLASTTGTTGRLDQIIDTLYLYIDGEEVGSESVNGAGTANVTFDDIDVTIDEDDEVEFEIRADISEQDDNQGNYNTGAGIQVTGVSIDFVDENDDDQTLTDSTRGGQITFFTTGINATLSGTPSAVARYGSFSGDVDRGTFTITFKVTAFGEDDIYIGGEGTTGSSNAGITYTLTNPGSAVITSAELTSTADEGDNGTFVVNSDDTETFTFTVQIQDSDTNASDVAQRLTITGIKWDTDDDATPDNTYTTNLGDFKTPSITI